MSLQPLVLVVDDDRDIRASIHEVLSGEGYTVEEACNGRDALLRLERPPLPALILLDLMMPVMDGRSLLAELGERPDLAGVPVIVATASGIDVASSSLEVPLLRKPLDIESLLNIVAQYAPRFWDDEEGPTEQRSLLIEPMQDTARHFCAACGKGAQTRCVGCGHAFCERCLNEGLSGLCGKCWKQQVR